MQALKTIFLLILISVVGTLMGSGNPSTSVAKKERIQLINRGQERRVDVLIDGKLFTSYLYPETIKKPVLYPLRTASGTLVTRGFPLAPRPGERVDHPHHVGLWFNYGDVNGLDFWNNSDSIQPEKRKEYGTIRHRKVNRLINGDESATLEVSMDWLSPEGKVLLREDTRFVFRGSDPKQKRGYRSVDRITTLTALEEEVFLKDNKEGLMALRVSRALEQPSDKPEIFTDASGRPTAVPVMNNEGVTGLYRSSTGLEGDAVWGTRASWVSLSGQIGAEPVTLSIFDNPANVGYPTYWHARGYGLFAANNLGQKALSEGKEELNFRLPAGKSVTFRHRIAIYSGSKPGDQELNVEAAQFSAVK